MTESGPVSDISASISDAAQAVALLKFYLDAGADAAIEDTPLSRFGLAGTRMEPAAPKTSAPIRTAEPAAQKTAAPRAQITQAAAILGANDRALAESARAAAASATSLDELKEILGRFEGIESLRGRATNM